MLGSVLESRSAPFQAIPRRSWAWVSHFCLIFGREELVGELGKVGHRHVQSLGNAPEGAPGRVGFAPLDQRQRFRRDAGFMRQVFLRRPSFGPQLADRFAQSGLRVRRLSRITIQDMCLKAARLNLQT